jgi:hypothetical protein
MLCSPGGHVSEVYATTSSTGFALWPTFEPSAVISAEERRAEKGTTYEPVRWLGARSAKSRSRVQFPPGSLRIRARSIEHGGNMLQFEKAITGRLKIVQAEEIEALTLSGWRLVLTYQDTVLWPYMETEPPPPQTTYSTSYTSNMAVQVTRCKPCTATRFVMQLDEQNALAQMNNDLESVKKALENEKNAHRQTHRDLDAQAKKVTEAKKAVDEYSQKNTSFASQLDTARTSNRKLESDIAKIRTAVGELKLKEILG